MRGGQGGIVLEGKESDENERSHRYRVGLTH